MTETTEADLVVPDTYAILKKGLGKLAENLDTSALALLEDGRRIAQLLGAQVIAPEHLALAKLLSQYQVELKKDAQGGQDFSDMLSTISTGIKIVRNTSDRSLPPSEQTKIVILKAPHLGISQATLPGQKTSRENILVLVAEQHPVLKQALSGIRPDTPHNYRETVYKPRILQVVELLKPTPPISGAKTA